MEEIIINLPKGKKAFFASDFHLGTRSYRENREREKRIVEWIESHKEEMSALFLLGDIFDYWFEYRYVVPKGFVRLLGCLARLSDSGVAIHFFCGNHDLWLRDYFQKELGIHIHTGNALLKINGMCIMIGHGDGFNPKERSYRIMKTVFGAKLSKMLFGSLHPYWASSLAQSLSRHSRKKVLKKNHREKEKKKNTQLILHMKEFSSQRREIQAFILAHRHWPAIYDLQGGKCVEPATVQLEKNDIGRYYINTGDWIHYDTFVELDGNRLTLQGKEIKYEL